MKTLYIWILTALLTCSAHAWDSRKEYRWTDLRGRTVMAEFVDLRGNLLKLRKNGRVFTVSLRWLSPRSANLARKLDAPPGSSGVNARVLAFSASQIGRKVGNGQCTSLAMRALEKAGARGIIRDFPAPGDYVWGNLAALISAEGSGVQGMATLSRARGGDIIQMRNVFLQGRSRTGGTYWMQAAHHTAVLESVDPARGILTVLHQNWNCSGVRRDVFVLRDLQRGWMRIYRPIKRN